MSQIENRLRNMEYRCQEAAGEIERLLEENKRLLDRCISLVEGVERLRELLKECQEYVEAGMSSVDTELCDRIEKEVGDG